MSGISEGDLRHLRTTGGVDRKVFVETGVLRADTTILASTVFEQVHGVEMSLALYLAAERRCRPNPKIKIWHASSPDFIKIARWLREPVVWFLDAHWDRSQPGISGGGATQSPLEEELRLLAERAQVIPGDVIVVDDIHAFGQEGWEHVSREWIAGFFPTHVVAYDLGDVFVVEV